MSHGHIPPFYFPTTVVFVDDNTDFLENLSLQLAPDLAFRLSDSPERALEMLNGGDNQTTPVERLFSCYQHSGDLPMTHHVIDVNLDKIHREVYNESRFGQISVAVVDYDMPGMDGIEFCRSIKNPAIKKILLTGKADEKIAVQAFNQGIINRFILKQDKDVIATLNRDIPELQRAYFSQTERMLADALAIGKHDFLRDPLFAARFREICGRLKIVEFYLCSEPDGLLMLDAEGAASLLLVQDEEAMRSQYEIAEAHGAPQELLNVMKSNQVVPYFWEAGGYYAPECRNWRAFMFPATEFKGKQWYCYAIVKNPPPFKAQMVVPYNQFIKEFDRQWWCGNQ